MTLNKSSNNPLQFILFSIGLIFFFFFFSGGRYMEFDLATMMHIGNEFLRGKSPAEALLTKWGYQNHTILELFVLLLKMHHYQAMNILKPFGKSLKQKQN